MEIKFATSWKQLQEQVLLVSHASIIPEQELHVAISRAAENLDAVSSERSRALAEILVEQYAEAKAIHATVPRMAALRDLALWTNGIKLGWL